MKSRTEGEVWLVSWLPTGGDLITVHTYPCPCRNQFSDFKKKISHPFRHEPCTDECLN